MSLAGDLDRSPGARFAFWWVETLTRTAEYDAAVDRRAEVASDVHEQLADAGHRDVSSGSRAVMARTIRGIPSDVSWRMGLELRVDRLAWHVRNPSTAITTLLVGLVPLTVFADSYVKVEPGARPLHGYAVPVWAAARLIGGAILVLALLALAARLRPGWFSGAEQFRPRSRLERSRRQVTAALGIALGASAALRFTALDLASGLLWIAFVLGVMAYLALVIASIFTRLLTLGRYLPKIGT